MKRFPIIIIVLSCFLININGAFCSETYYIGNNRVLLYKVINWWYDCLPQESTDPCGRPIKCQSKGDARVEYHVANMTLKLHINGGFAELLSIFKECEQCFGPTYLKCIWLNKKYFGGGEAAIVSNDFPGISAFIFSNVDNNHSRIIQSIEKDIEFVLEGKVGGLLNGKIALHRVGEFIKGCPEASQNSSDIFPTSLKIKDSSTKETLAKYSIVFDH